jgi:RNA polymerase sigma factor (sigma-70 family)
MEAMPETPELDAEIVAAVRGGAVARFAEIVRRHDAGVRGVVARIVRDRHEREEAVQQTFYLALRHLDGLAEPGRVGGWLARIARRVSVDRARERAREAARTNAAASGSLPSTAEPAAEWIWEDVERLGALHKDVLVLRYREGLRYEEIARRLGVPHSTVRGRIHEARRALRERLAEETS